MIDFTLTPFFNKVGARGSSTSVNALKLPQMSTVGCGLQRVKLKGDVLDTVTGAKLEVKLPAALNHEAAGDD